MTAAVHDHKFNDDLLLDESDRELAERKYPTIYHVLDHAELRQLFCEYDAPADRAKRNGLRYGLSAIGFGFLALALAALEIPVTHAADAQSVSYDQTKNWVSVLLAAVSGICGILSFLIGSVGVLFAQRKREWLYHGLMGESVRLFHFQTLVFRLPQILASLKDDEGKSEFLSERKLWLESFKARMMGRLDSVFAATIEEEGETDLWLRDGAKTREATPA